MTAKRQTVLGLTAGAILAAAIGILGVLHATAFDPADVQAELEVRIAELNAIPDTEPVRKDAFAEKLLADESYRTHARALYAKIERAHPKLHEAAQVDRAAQKEVLPFLARCKDLAKIPKAELPDLLSEARSLLSKYPTTRFGDLLRANVQALQQAVDAIPRVSPQDVMTLSRDVKKWTHEGRYAAAYAAVKEFQKKADHAVEFHAQLGDLLRTILRQAEAEIVKLRNEATASEGARQRVVERLEGPDFKGLPSDLLESTVSRLKRR